MTGRNPPGEGCPCCAGREFSGPNPIVGCVDCGHFIEVHRRKRCTPGLTEATREQGFDKLEPEELADLAEDLWALPGETRTIAAIRADLGLSA